MPVLSPDADELYYAGCFYKVSCTGDSFFCVCIVSGYYKVFPASGYCLSESGAFNNVGTGGYSWSSSAAGTGSYWSTNLNTNLTWVNPLNNNRRTYGFPIRCVQELAGLLLISR